MIQFIPIYKNQFDICRYKLIYIYEMIQLITIYKSKFDICRNKLIYILRIDLSRYPRMIIFFCVGALLAF